MHGTASLQHTADAQAAGNVRACHGSVHVKWLPQLHSVKPSSYLMSSRCCSARRCARTAVHTTTPVMGRNSRSLRQW